MVDPTLLIDEEARGINVSRDRGPNYGWESFPAVGYLWRAERNHVHPEVARQRSRDTRGPEMNFCMGIEIDPKDFGDKRKMARWNMHMFITLKNVRKRKRPLRTFTMEKRSGEY